MKNKRNNIKQWLVLFTIFNQVNSSYAVYEGENVESAINSGVATIKTVGHIRKVYPENEFRVIIHSVEEVDSFTN